MEEWRSVIGYEGYYEVSSFGRVRSTDRKITKSNGVIQNRTGREKKPHVNQDGYPVVHLNKDGKTKTVAVHRLVASAFIRKLVDGEEVDHLDFDRTNNNARNLRIVTHLENIRHTKEAGRHISDSGFSGVRNPNYGSRTLRNKYKENPDLAKEKQSRPGGVNGRARRIRAILSGDTIEFPCITYCARYVLDTHLLSGLSIGWLSTTIRRHAESGIPYKNMVFEII